MIINTKKIIVFLAAMLLALTLLGCSVKDNNEVIYEQKEGVEPNQSKVTETPKEELNAEETEKSLEETKYV